MGSVLLMVWPGADAARAAAAAPAAAFASGGACAPPEEGPGAAPHGYHYEWGLASVN